MVAGKSSDLADESFSLVRYNATGTPDMTFGARGKVLTQINNACEANAVAILADGKILAAGYSGDSDLNSPASSFTIVKYNSDGTLDTSFGSGGIANTVITSGGVPITIDVVIRAITVQTDGKIIAVGNASNNNTPFITVTRFNSNGTLDNSFGTGGIVFPAASTGGTYAGIAYAVALQGSKIVVAGQLTTSELAGILRFNSNGTLDNTFGSGGAVILDTEIGSYRSTAYSPAFLSTTAGNDKIVLAGEIVSGFNTNIRLWSRSANNGSPDTTFGTAGRVTVGDPQTASSGSGRTIRIVFNNLSPSGILVGGRGINDFRAVRFLLDGTLNTGFGVNGIADVDVNYSSNDIGNAMVLQPDNKIVLVGSSNTANLYDADFGIVRLKTNGTLDTTFSGNGKTLADVGNKAVSARKTLVQTDGKIITAGSPFIARFNSDGTADNSFDDDGVLKIPFRNIKDAVIQPDGKIVVVANTEFPDTDTANANKFYVYRFNADSTPDVTFDGDGIVTTDLGTNTDAANGIAIQTDGKIFLAGSASGNFAAARYNPDGSLDTTFSFDGKVTTPVGTGNAAANGLAIQTDGKIVLAGYATNGSKKDFALLRYNSDATLDTSFDADGKQTTPIGTRNDVGNALAIQPDGKILVAGSTETAAFINDFAVVRYNSDGSLDSSMFASLSDSDTKSDSQLYGNGGKVVVDVSGGGNDLGNTIALDSLGRAVVAGQADKLFGIVRILGNVVTAANVSVSGRILTADGSGLTNASVIMTDTFGETRTTHTSSFGYYRFEDVPAGQAYVFEIRSKRYQFAPQVVTLIEDLRELNFTAVTQP